LHGVSICGSTAAQTHWRPALASLNPSERAQLSKAILDWLSDSLILSHDRTFHFSGDPDTEDYAAFVAPLESHLASKGLTRLTPLPSWEPSQEIPPEFLAAKTADDGASRRKLPRRSIRAYPEAGRLQGAALCQISQTELDEGLSRWHDFVLEDMGGIADTEEASAAPIVWCWHAFLADVRRAWRDCRR
jgi:hypothetical protein